MHDFLPVAMRDITKSAPEDGRSGWDDVGGLIDIQNAIKEVKSLYLICVSSHKFTIVFSLCCIRSLTCYFSLF